MMTLAFWGFPLLVVGFIIATQCQFLFEPLKLYGDAHFATRSDIKKMGFFNEKGNLIVGKFQGTLLRYSLTNHALLFAPSRSGKGVSFVIPNALNWSGSLFVLDNKYELFEATSGFRSRCGQKVYRFSPAEKNGHTHCINPLDYVNQSDDARCISDLHLILDILIKGSSGIDPMWVEEARSFALGLLLWLMKSDRLFALSELSAIAKDGANLIPFLMSVIETHQTTDGGTTLHPMAYLSIQNYLQKADKEQSGVRSNLTAMLRLWEDPYICSATNRSDIDLRQLRKEPISLYLSFGTHQLSRLAPLISLITQCFLMVMLEELPKDDEPYKVLGLLDEFSRFGKMEKLKDGFGDLAGYGVHLVAIIQNVGQFYATYGGIQESDIFFQNTDLKIAFRQNAETDKKLVSDMLGKKTVRIKNRSYQTSRTGSNYSETLIERPLLTPFEIGKFSKKQELIITGDGVIKGQKICYYKDKYFKKHILKPIDIPKILPKFPTIAPHYPKGVWDKEVGLLDDDSN